VKDAKVDPVRPRTPAAGPAPAPAGRAPGGAAK
jgi:hypothetical protein